MIARGEWQRSCFDDSQIHHCNRERRHIYIHASTNTQIHVFATVNNTNNKHRVVDRFKMRLRDALEQTIKKKGGVSHAIIREAFLDWDADASGKLDPRELVRGGVRENRFCKAPTSCSRPFSAHPSFV